MSAPVAPEAPHGLPLSERQAEHPCHRSQTCAVPAGGVSGLRRKIGGFSTLHKTHTMKSLLILSAAALFCTSALAEDAKTLPSGVKVAITTAGTGATPKASDTVKVHYRGTLANGTEFDSSIKRGAPATFPLGRVVPCWTEGFQHIKVGSKAVLTCPPATAYGERGAGGVIPPNATLTFEVELLAIEK